VLCLMQEDMCMPGLEPVRQWCVVYLWLFVVDISRRLQIRPESERTTVSAENSVKGESSE